MKNESLSTIFNESKSVSEILKKLELSDNTRNRDKIKKIANEIYFDLNTYNKRNDKFCLQCGTKLKKGQEKFCSRSCSASFNNKKRLQTDETKNKIRNSLILNSQLKKDKFINEISVENIEKIKILLSEGKTYKEIKEIILISMDKLIKVCRLLKNKKYIKNNNALSKSEDIINYYKIHNSLRLTAKEFNLDRATIRKVIPDSLIIDNNIKLCNKTIEEKLKAKSKKVIDWRIRKKEILVEYKGGKCEVCGYEKCIKALEFHHLNPEEKDFTISGKSYSLEKLKKEVDKCILVCSNCHSEIHEDLRNLNKEFK